MGWMENARFEDKHEWKKKMKIKSTLWVKEKLIKTIQFTAITNLSPFN